MTDATRELKTALGHIEHLAAFISKNADKAPGYSFESLGEDIDAMRAAAYAKPQDQITWPLAFVFAVVFVGVMVGLLYPLYLMSQPIIIRGTL